jgi:hypothetical protein
VDHQLLLAEDHLLRLAAVVQWRRYLRGDHQLLLVEDHLLRLAEVVQWHRYLRGDHQLLQAEDHQLQSEEVFLRLVDPQAVGLLCKEVREELLLPLL